MNEAVDENAVNQLIEEGLICGEDRAREYVRRKGRCVYCGHDVVHNRLGYATLEFDHLLPRAKFSDLPDDQNLVLACWLCNRLKGDYDPSDKHPSMLETAKSQLIENSRSYIGNKRVKEDKAWRKVRQIILGLVEWPDDIS